MNERCAFCGIHAAYPFLRRALAWRDVGGRPVCGHDCEALERARQAATPADRVIEVREIDGARTVDQVAWAAEHPPQGAAAPAGMLHLHAQPWPHGDAWLVGDAAALESLRDAIGRALVAGSAAAHTFAADGEGYPVLVAVDDLAMGEPLLPYAEVDERPGGRPGEHPYNRLPQGRYWQMVRGGA